MSQWIDREHELSTLEREYNRKGAAFVVIYGRRRVGKTTLIAEFCKKHRTIFFLATKEGEEQNMAAFKNTIAQSLNQSFLSQVKVDRWEVLFDVIAQAARMNEKLIVVMDEFQYLGKANSAFPSVLMRIWDEKLKDTNIMLILCGSLIRMMTTQVLNYNSPLYGRRTAQIRMKQIPFAYYHEFMPQRNQDELVQRYAVTGGVPKYIGLFEDEDDIYLAIRKNVLDTNSFLYAEPEFLLGQEVTEVGNYFSILRAIAAGNRKLDRIASFLEVKQNNLTFYLKILMELDLVEREVPITEKNPERSKKGLYKIKDNFIRFWFQYVYPYQALLETGRWQNVDQLIREQFVEKTVSYVYEDICRERVYDIYAERVPIAKVGRWWGEQEIDIVGISADESTLILGECKYSAQPKGLRVLMDLLGKENELRHTLSFQPEHIYYILFSRSGFTAELQAYAKEHQEICLQE